MSKSLIDVSKQFGTEEACLKYLEALRWPNGVACVADGCGSTRISRIRSTNRAGKPRYIFQCLVCRHQFTTKSGTIFNDSHLPLQTWFLAVALIVNAKKSVSAKQIQRDLGVSYRTAWYLNMRIREAMQDGGAGMFSGQVEVDETFVGGRYDKRRRRQPWEKQPVVGILQRGDEFKCSKVEAFPIPTTSKAVLSGVVRDRISQDAELLCTDESPNYKAVGRDYRRHAVVNHIAQEYARRSGDTLISTNGIENFWSLFKRGSSASSTRCPSSTCTGTWTSSPIGFRTATRRTCSR